jgi:hypothetical protein
MVIIAIILRISKSIIQTYSHKIIKHSIRISNMLLTNSLRYLKTDSLNPLNLIFKLIISPTSKTEEKPLTPEKEERGS